MCGIIAGFNKRTPKNKDKKAINAKPINDFILNQYEDQYNRGQKGFGIIRIEKNGNIEIDRATEPTKFLLDLYLKPSTMIIAHHRTPTSTENKIQQTHPIKISNKKLKFDYYAVHNGMISNDEELKKKHEKLGFEYTTKCFESVNQYYKTNKTEKWNDSEAIAIELALFIEGKIKTVRTENGAAFIILQVNKKTNLAQKCFFGRNGFNSILNICKSKGNLLISSEGKGEEVKEGKLFSFHTRDNKMKLTSIDIPFKKEEKPIEIKTEAPKEIESTMPKNVAIVPVENEKPKVFDKVITAVRSWIDIEKDPILDLDFDAAVFTDKNYKETISEDFKYKLKNCTTEEIKSTLDDSLDEEIAKIEELCTNFKEICQCNKIELPERNFFISQIANLFRTMEAITDIASDEFAIVQQKEDEETIADYNTGFELNDDGSYGKGPKKYDSSKHINVANHYGQGIYDDDYNDFNRFG